MILDSDLRTSLEISVFCFFVPQMFREFDMQDPSHMSQNFERFIRVASQTKTKLFFEQDQSSFGNAMKLMNLDSEAEGVEWSRTPMAKKPKSLDSVEKGIAMTPSPVVNQQSVTWLL